MKSNIRVAAIQMVSTDDLAENLKNAQLLMSQAASEGAQLIVLPEYFCMMGLRDHDKLAVAETLGEGPIQAF